MSLRDQSDPTRLLPIYDSGDHVHLNDAVTMPWQTATVERWARRETAAIGKVELAIRVPQPLTVRRGDRSLQIRLATTRSQTMHLLFLQVEDPMSELAKLSSLELGSRATQVLYWLAKGKTNKEIGIILGMAAETVKAQLKKSFGGCTSRIEQLRPQ